MQDGLEGLTREAEGLRHKDGHVGKWVAESGNVQETKIPDSVLADGPSLWLVGALRMSTPAIYPEIRPGETHLGVYNTR